MKTLLDPGKCTHPPDKQKYNGEQETLGEPLYLWTCQQCGTTMSGKKPDSEYLCTINE